MMYATVFIAILVLLVWVGASYVVFRAILSPKSMRFHKIRKPRESSTANHNPCLYSWLDQVQKVTISANDGAQLNGYWVSHSSDAPWIVLIHGYGSRATRMGKYMDHLLKSGYQVLAVDLRCHGCSGGKYIGLGWLDKDDIHCWIQWLRQRDFAAQIILYGTSMGAATALLYGGYYAEQIRGIISDCAPSDMTVVIRRVLSHRLRWFHNAVFPLVLFFTRWFAKYSLADAAAIRSAENITAPVLFIHGREDGFVPSYMAEDLYRLTKSRKRILIVDQADHMQSLDAAPGEYWKHVDDFICDTCS